jgi:hypothetical protein
MIDKLFQYFIDRIKQIDSPDKIVFGFVLIFLIAFSDNFSDTLMNDLSLVLRHPLGMSVGFFVILAIAGYIGWIYGLLAVVVFVLLVKGHKLSYEKDVTVEQFSDLVKKKTQGHRWFIEKVMNENPKTIETDRVETVAVQG